MCFYLPLVLQATVLKLIKINPLVDYRRYSMKMEPKPGLSMSESKLNTVSKLGLHVILGLP